MTQVYDQDVDIHVGKVGGPLPNWRKMPEARDESDPDDDDEKTPESVEAVLGFDPDELFGEET